LLLGFTALSSRTVAQQATESGSRLMKIIVPGSNGQAGWEIHQAVFPFDDGWQRMRPGWDIAG